MATDVREREPQIPETSRNGIPTDPTEIIERAERILGGDIRPEDYLPVIDEIETEVHAGIAVLVRYQPEIIVTEEGIERFRCQTTLNFYCGGETVLARSDSTGVIVLAMGDENVLLISRQISPSKWAGFGIEYPIAWGSES